MTFNFEGKSYSFDEENPKKTDYGIIKESGKHPIRYVWVEESIQDFNKGFFELGFKRMECTSRGIITIEGKKINCKEASDIFKALNFGK